MERLGTGARDAVRVRIPSNSPAVRDRSWMATLSTHDVSPLEVMATGVDPHWSDLHATYEASDLVVDIRWSDTEAKRREEVEMTYISHGPNWQFEDRGVPLTVLPTRRLLSDV